MQVLGAALYPQPVFPPLDGWDSRISQSPRAACGAWLTTLVVSPVLPFHEILRDASRTLYAPAHLNPWDVFMAADITPEQFQSIHQPTRIERHRFHLLDGLRGLAAMLVVLYHSPLQLQTRFHFGNSYLAVDFFFCLSGFVVAYSYLGPLRGTMRLRDFAATRFIRLYPLFAVSMLFSVLRIYFSPLKLHDVSSSFDLGILIASSVLMVPNLWVSGLGGELFPLNVPAWSLLLEVLANLVFAAAVRSGRSRALLPLLYAISLCVLLAAVSQRESFDMGAEWRGAAIGVARAGVSFIAGAGLLALYSRRPLGGLPSGHATAAAIALTTIFLCSLMLPSRWTGNARYPLCMALLLFPVLVYAGARCTLPASLHGLCAFLGEASYPLYILHVPLMLPYGSLLSSRLLQRHPAAQPWLVLLDLAILLPLCWWIGHRFDMPLRHRLTAAYKSLLRPPSVQRPHFQRPS